MAAVPTAFRIPVDDLAEIDRRAELHGLSRTQYVLRAALDRLDVEPGSTTEARLDGIEARLSRLEALAGS